MSSLTTALPIAQHYAEQGFYFPIEAIPPEVARDATRRLEEVIASPPLGLKHPRNIKAHCAKDVKSAHDITDLPAENIITFTEPLVHHPTQHLFDELCGLIIARGWGSAHIGVDFDAHH